MLQKLARHVAPAGRRVRVLSSGSSSKLPASRTTILDVLRASGKGAVKYVLDDQVCGAAHACAKRAGFFDQVRARAVRSA